MKNTRRDKRNITIYCTCFGLVTALALILAIMSLAKPVAEYTEIEVIKIEEESYSLHEEKLNIEILEQSEPKLCTLLEEVEPEKSGEESSLIYIRCTVYCDTGYTASGVWTTDGCLAGRKEWLGKSCNLYKVNKDGSCGELIDTYTFYDTGFGLKELDGVKYPEGTIKVGASIDMWHANEDLCWDWVGEYGDYVYMEFIP